MSQGLNVKCWGNPAWNFLHSVAMGYVDSPTPQMKEAYKNFFYSLVAILPCPSCRTNYLRNLKQIPIEKYLNNRRNLSLWVYKIHNLVNDEKNVPVSVRPSFEKVYELYKSIESGCDKGGICGSDDQEACPLMLKSNMNYEAFSSIESVFQDYWVFILIAVCVIGIAFLCYHSKKRKRSK